MGNSVYVIEKKLLASDGDRFLNCILDLIFVFVTFFLFSLAIVIVGNIFNWDIYSIWDNFFTSYTYSALLVLLMFSYLVLEWLFGRTFGKLITGTVVVNEKGLKPDFGAIFIRTLCRLIPFDALSFLRKSGRIWHDSISETYVVNKKALNLSRELFYGFQQIGEKE
ncbi:MAG: RDD family protein [Bacteroidota bacterium]